jgi:redox-sensing transcriptional repressor
MKNKSQIFRLLNYKNLLKQLKTLGFKKVFSDNISDTLEISSSLVRKDFGTFGITGNRKGGYDIHAVLEKIDDILGKDQVQRVIVIGVGRIGQALMRYNGFSNEGIEIVAGFDTDSNKIDEKGDIPIYSIDKLQEYVAKNKIRIAIMSVPKLAAKHTVEILEHSGIGGVLNFTAMKFKSHDDLTINNIDIVNELENLIYQVNNKEEDTIE